MGKDKSATIRSTILSLVDDDYYGLWEVLWKLHDAVPDISEPKLIQQARLAILDLASINKLAVFRREGMLGKEQQIAVAQLSVVLASNSVWSEPEHKDSMQILVTTVEM
jgi:hypothetical protein